MEVFGLRFALHLLILSGDDGKSKSFTTFKGVLAGSLNSFFVCINYNCFDRQGCNIVDECDGGV